MKMSSLSGLRGSAGGGTYDYNSLSIEGGDPSTTAPQFASPGVNQSLDLKQVDALVRSLDDYEVQKPLGSGGMGLIYLVRQKLTNRLEVLKVLRPELAQRQRLKDRFLREVQVAARLDHPNVVKTYTAIDRGFLALVIEYVPGMDLDSMVRKHGPLRIDIAATIVAQAARGLEYAVSRGLVHRDIKPSNILVSKVGKTFQAKLSDFGLCKDIELNENDGLTVEGRFLGTPEYVAPEQALDPSNSTVASDVYGLGCTLFFALTGRPPYSGTNTIAVLNAHINSPIPDIREFRKDVPDGIRMLLEGMLQKDFRARFQSPQLVAERLEALRDAPMEAAAQPAYSSVADVVTTQAVAVEATASDEAPMAPLMSAPPLRPTPPRRPAPARAKKSGIPFSMIAQILMPIIFLSIVVMYFRPWVPPSTRGTLLLDNMTPDVLVKINDRVINNGTERTMKVDLEAGQYDVKYMYGDHHLETKHVELKRRQEYTLEVTFRDLDRRFPDVKNPPPKDLRDNQFAHDKPLGGSPQPPVNGDTGGLGTSPFEETGPAEDTKPKEPTPPPKAFKYELVAENLSTFSVEQERVLQGVDVPPTRLALIPKDVLTKDEVVVSLSPRIHAWGITQPNSVTLRPSFLNLTTMTVTPNKNWALYANDYNFEVYSLTKPAPPRKSTLDMNTKRVYALSADSKYLGCCDYSESFSKFNLQTGQLESSISARLPIGTGEVKALALTARLDQALVLSQAGKLLCWETTKGNQLGEAASDMAEVPIDMHLINLANQSNQVITVSMRGEFEIRKLPKLELVGGYRLFDNMTTASCASNRLLAMADSSGQVCVVDLNDSLLVARLPPKPDCQVSAVALSADSKILAVGYSNSTIGVFNLRRLVAPKTEVTRE